MIFWVIVGAMTLVALATLLLPLLRKEQGAELDRRLQNITIYRHRMQELEADVSAGVLPAEDAASAREELMQRLPQDLAQQDFRSRTTNRKNRLLIMALVVLLPLLGTALYIYRGGIQRLHTSRNMHRLQSNANQLAQKLNEHPKNPQEWFLLGKMRMSLRHYSKAATAYAQAETYSPNPSARLLSRQAQALGMAAGGDFRGKPNQLLKHALEINPFNTEALWLSGVAEEESNKPARALSYWKQINQANLPKPFKGLLDKRISQIKQALSEKSQ